MTDGGSVTQPEKRPVLFDQDGGIDDLISLTMLLAMPHIDLQGVVVTPADCFLRPAVSASLKILRFFDRLDVELCEGTLHGVNPFPRAWRSHPYAVDALPILNEIRLPDGDTTSVDTPERPRRLPGVAWPPPFETMRSQPYNPFESLESLKKRLKDELLTRLQAGVNAFAPQKRYTLQALFEKVLSAENIILSRVERNRLFQAIATDIYCQMNDYLPTPLAEPGHQFLARKLREAEEPLTVLITGPVTNLAAALTAEPALAEKVEQVVWMGGAVNVPGNVRDYDHDGSAEWNAYWDPPSTYNLWQTDVPINLFSLDATNHVQVKRDFLHRLAQQRRYPLSDLVGQCWALTVGTIPSYEYTYYMWDTLTTGYLGAPRYITFREVRSEVIPHGPSAGRIKEVDQGGKPIRLADTVDVEGFQHYLLELFRR